MMEVSCWHVHLIMEEVNSSFTWVICESNFLNTLKQNNLSQFYHHLSHKKLSPVEKGPTYFDYRRYFALHEDKTDSKNQIYY